MQFPSRESLRETLMEINVDGEYLGHGVFLVDVSHTKIYLLLSIRLLIQSSLDDDLILLHHHHLLVGPL